MCTTGLQNSSENHFLSNGICDLYSESFVSVSMKYYQTISCSLCMWMCVWWSWIVTNNYYAGKYHGLILLLPYCIISVICTSFLSLSINVQSLLCEDCKSGTFLIVEYRVNYWRVRWNKQLKIGKSWRWTLELQKLGHIWRWTLEMSSMMTQVMRKCCQDSWVWISLSKVIHHCLNTTKTLSAKMKHLWDS